MDVTETAPLSCIKCGRALEAAIPGVQNNQPFNGTTFTSHGHYGSTVWDPMSSNTWLEINICDPCVRDAAKAKLILLGRKPHSPVPPIAYRTWDPEDDDASY